FAYLVDLAPDDHAHATYFIKVDDLPSQYLPSETSYYETDAAPGVLHPDGKHQDVFVDDEWGYEQIARYPRQYLQTYNVHALFGVDGDATALDTIHYTLTQGWVFNTLFKKFGAHVSAAKRAHLSAVAVASPGYIR